MSADEAGKPAIDHDAVRRAELNDVRAYNNRRLFEASMTSKIEDRTTLDIVLASDSKGGYTFALTNGAWLGWQMREVVESRAHQPESKDAARYRWLRECSPFSSARGAVTVNWPVFDNGRLIQPRRSLFSDDLDAAIDKAIAAESKPDTRDREQGE